MSYQVSSDTFGWVDADSFPDARERSFDHSPEEHASRCQYDCKGHWLGAPTGTESVHHLWPHEKGDGEGGNGHSPQYYQSHEQKAVMVRIVGVRASNNDIVNIITLLCFSGDMACQDRFHLEHI